MEALKLRTAAASTMSERMVAGWGGVARWATHSSPLPTGWPAAGAVRQ